MPLHAREEIGRNDPWPCGSGKKYKHCCLPGYAPSIDHVWARQHEESDRLTGEITRFALRYLAPHDLLRYADLIRATYLDIRDRLFAPPVLCNTDGDPLLFHTLTFRIESAEAAFDALAPLAVGHSREDLLDDAELMDDWRLRKVDIDWIKEGNRKFKTWDNTILVHIKISEGRVIVEVNSENRAKRMRKEIEKRLGTLATHESTLAQTLEQMRKN